MSCWRVGTRSSQTLGDKTCKYLKSDNIRVFSHPDFSASFTSVLGILVVVWGNSLCEDTLWKARNTVSNSILSYEGGKLLLSLPELPQHGCVDVCVQYACVHAFVLEFVLYFLPPGNSRPFSVCRERLWTTSTGAYADAPWTVWTGATCSPWRRVSCPAACPASARSPMKTQTSRPRKILSLPARYSPTHSL